MAKLYILGVYLPQRQSRISDFDEHVAMLANLIKLCKDDGEVLVIGDMNCHFGPERGNRFWGESTPNANTLYSMMDHEGLTLVDNNNEHAQVQITVSMSQELGHLTLTTVL